MARSVIQLPPSCIGPRVRAWRSQRVPLVSSFLTFFGRLETIHRSCDQMPSANAVASAKGTLAVKRKRIHAAHCRGKRAVQESMSHVKARQGSSYRQCSHLGRNLAMHMRGIRHEMGQAAQLTKRDRQGSVDVVVGAHVEQLQRVTKSTQLGRQAPRKAILIQPQGDQDRKQTQL